MQNKGVTGIKYTVWGDLVTNYVMSLYGGKIITRLIMMIILECIEI